MRKEIFQKIYSSKKISLTVPFISLYLGCSVKVREQRDEYSPV